MVFFQVYIVVGIAGVALIGCVLMVIILKYGRNSKFGMKGKDFLFHLSLVIFQTSIETCRHLDNNEHLVLDAHFYSFNSI